MLRVYKNKIKIGEKNIKYIIIFSYIIPILFLFFRLHGPDFITNSQLFYYYVMYLSRDIFRDESHHFKR